MLKCFPKEKFRRGCVKRLAGPKSRLELTGVKTHILMESKKYRNVFFVVSRP
jgi:hypothetical protein